MNKAYFSGERAGGGDTFVFLLPVRPGGGTPMARASVKNSLNRSTANKNWNAKFKRYI